MNATETQRSGAAGRPGGEALPAPVITVTRGRPTSAELAAVTAVLLAARSAAAAAAAAAQAAQGTRPPLWAAGSRLRSASPIGGPHAWRASALPR